MQFSEWSQDKINYLKMKQYKYRINGSLYNVVVNSTTDEIAEVEVNGTPYTVEIEKKSKKQKPHSEKWQKFWKKRCLNFSIIVQEVLNKEINRLKSSSGIRKEIVS